MKLWIISVVGFTGYLAANGQLPDDFEFKAGDIRRRTSFMQQYREYEESKVAADADFKPELYDATNLFVQEKGSHLESDESPLKKSENQPENFMASCKKLFLQLVQYVSSKR